MERHTLLGIDDLVRSEHERIRVQLDPILKRQEDELIEEALADLPEVILQRKPRVMFENNGMPLGRWLMFGRPPHGEWLELSSVSYDVLTERFVDPPTC